MKQYTMVFNAIKTQTICGFPNMEGGIVTLERLLKQQNGFMLVYTAYIYYLQYIFFHFGLVFVNSLFSVLQDLATLSGNRTVNACIIQSKPL